MLNTQKSRFIPKTVFITVVLNLLFSNISSFSQSGWYPLVSGTSQALWASFFTDVNTGYVAGANGVFLKTTNSGTNWISYLINTTYTLKSVFFVDPNTGFMAGGGTANNQGVIYKTTNAGINWTELNLPVSRHLYSVFFVNPTTGYTAGYKAIFKTTDAGSNWMFQTLPDSTIWVNSVYFRDANTGYAAEGTGSGNTLGHILRTTNEGENWGFVRTYVGADVCSISFSDANTGIAVTGGTYNSHGGILRTTDSGNNWTNLNYTNDLINLFTVKFVDSNTGYITGAVYSPYRGIVLKSTNTGSSWCRQDSYISQFLFSSSFTDINTGYVVGSSGLILKTTDGGGNCVIGIDPKSKEIPDKYSLEQNYPNPFNPSTEIKFSVPKTHFVELTVFDLLGREVATLVSEQLMPGTYEVQWDASNYPSGIYFYKLETNTFGQTRKMVLVK